MSISPPLSVVEALTPAVIEKKYITIEELEKHNKPDDLWISIQGKVYNVTHWSKEHPGGDIPLLNLAGQDVTDAFIAFHPGTAWKYLDKFFSGYHIKDYKVSEVSKDYRRLFSELVKAGVFEKKGHGFTYSLCFVILLLSACVYGVLNTDSFGVHMLSAAFLGLAWIQVAYLGHDSGHYQALATRGWNKFAGILIGNCTTGISIAWWKWTHNAHHIACNSLDYDPDLQHLPMLAVSDSLFQSLTSKFYGRKLTFDPVSKFFVSYQHLSYYPVMCVARVNLYLQTSFTPPKKKSIYCDHLALPKFSRQTAYIFATLTPQWHVIFSNSVYSYDFSGGLMRNLQDNKCDEIQACRDCRSSNEVIQQLPIVSRGYKQ